MGVIGVLGLGKPGTETVSPTGVLETAQHADAYLTRRGSCIFQHHLTRPNKTSIHSASLHVHTNNNQNKLLDASWAFPRASTTKLVMASYTYELIELGDDVHGLGCKCCRFSKGLDLPSPRKDLSTAEARKLAVGFATSVLRDWTALNAILKRFEGESNRSCGHFVSVGGLGIQVFIARALNARAQWPTALTTLSTP